MLKLFAALLAVLMCGSIAPAQNEAMVWEKDFKKAQELARESGRPLLLDFTAEWCKPCKAMDEQFWVLPDVIKASKPFVAVKINFDSQKSLVGKYNVSAIPFVAFTDPLGNLITFRRGFGSKNARELSQIFDEMPKDFSNLKKAYETLELKKDEAAALVQIADSYRQSKMLFLSNDFYKKALKTSEIQADAVKRERIAAIIGLNAYGYDDYKQAVNYLEDYLKDYPAGKSREVTIAVLSIANSNLGKMKESDKYLQQLKTEFSQSKNIAAVAKAIEDAKNKPEKKKN